MGRKKFLTLIAVMCLALVIAVIPFITACAKPVRTPAPAPVPAPAAPAPAPAPKPEPIKLSMVAWSKTGLDLYSYQALIDLVAERSNGELTIESKGAAEAIPAMEQFEAVRSGVVDIICSHGAYHTSVLPEARLISAGELSAEGQLPKKLFDFLVERYETVNIHFMGHAWPIIPFHIYVNKKWGWVKTPWDLHGLKTRTAGSLHLVFVKKLGITPIAMPIGDAYTALERGVVDGLTWPTDIYKYGLHEVLDYIICPPYKTDSNTCFFMNLDTWNSLPPHLQDIVSGAMIDVVREEYARDLDKYNSDLQTLLDKGMKIIEFTGGDAARYTSLYAEENWKALEEAVSPEDFLMMQGLVEQ